MRKAHDIPVFVKAGNLARWFPPWTVTREQWHSMRRPSVSGIAIDTFLFSRIGMPFNFLRETDVESIRRSHRRRAKEIAASMSQGVSASKKDQATTTSKRRTAQRTSAPRIRGQEQVPTVTPVAEMRQKTAMSAGHQRSVEEDTVQALMDLALPRFKKSDDQETLKTRPWPVALSSPTSPTSVDGRNRKSFWVDRLGEECAMAAAVNLQRDAGLMMSNLQILAQFVTVLHRMSSEIMSIGVGHVVFPTEDVAKLSRTPSGPSRPGAPGPVPTSSCTSCMRCDYCFPRREPPVHSDV